MSLVVVTLFILQGNSAVYAERLLPIYSVHRQDKCVALTFDCAWGAEDMEEILEILDRQKVKASFFVVGDWVRAYPEVAKAIVKGGHDIGNHSDKHPHVTEMTKEEIKKDIRLAHQSIKQMTGIDAVLYRPPYGEYNNTVIEAAKECDYETIQWNVDSLDWKEYGRQALIDKVLKHKNLVPGTIVLLHNGTDYTKDALEELICGLKTKGYTIIPVSQMLIQDDYYLDHEGRQYKVET